MSEAATFKRKRTLDHSVTFENGFAKGWKLLVGECFRPAFDIILTERVDTVKTQDGIKKRKALVYTQGVPNMYAFAEGDTIGTAPFPDDGNKDHIMFQVLEATPDIWDGQTGNVIEGSVVAQIFRPGNPSGWKETGRIRVTQKEFADLLRMGLREK